MNETSKMPRKSKALPRNNMKALIYVVLAIATMSLAGCDRSKYARAVIKASDSTDIDIQLDEIQKAFVGMPGATIGAKGDVSFAVSKIRQGLFQANLGPPYEVATDLTEAQLEQLLEHIDKAIKQSLDGFDAKKLVALCEEVMATGRGGAEFQDFFEEINRAAVKDFISKQKR